MREPWPLQLYADGDRWKVLIICALLNRAKGQTIRDRAILPRLFLRWATPAEMAAADVADVAEILRPLGFQNRRARLIVNMSEEYGDDVPTADLPGCGRYAAEAARVFVDGDFDFEPDDRVLAAYVRQTREASDGG